MKSKVYVTQPIPEKAKKNLEKYCEVDIWDRNKSIPREILLEKIKDVDGLLTAGLTIDNELLSKAKQLKVVSNISVGYNNFEIDDMITNKVVGTHTPNVLNKTVSDLVFGLMLSVSRRIPELDAFTRRGEWEGGNDSHLFGLDVNGATLGIIGLGRIGEEITKKATQGFDMNVIYHNRRQNHEAEETLNMTYASLDELLSRSDFIVLMTPLSNETYHLIGKNEFKKMKETAIFINASRGETVDEEALIEILSEKKIYGAGLDVFEKEPIDPNNPLLHLNNVVLTPHIGSATKVTRENMNYLAVDNVVEVLQEGTSENVIKEMKDRLSV